MNISRRKFSQLISTAFLAQLVLPGNSSAAIKPADELLKKINELENRLAARMGVVIFNTGSGEHFSHRADERFPMCSTFKLLAVAAILARVDAGKENLQRRISFGKNDLVSHSPITENHLTDGMSLAEMCEAAMTQSDNTAANLILQNLSGPSAITQFARKIGDKVTRLDRIETELNSAMPGDLRDTSSPRAMAENLRKLLLEDVLSGQSRDQLKRWLIANKTGDAKLRAGVPSEWIVGDKTGAGDWGSCNELAILWPSAERSPLIVSIYITETKSTLDECNKAIAELGMALNSLIVH